MTQLRLTLVMLDQVVQRVEGVARRDVESSLVQSPDLVMFDAVARASIAVSHR